LALALAAGCSSAPTGELPALTAAPVEPPPAPTPNRWFEKPWNVSLGAPGPSGDAIALLGGRRVRLFPDGRVELQDTSIDASLRWMGAVPTTSGESVWVGATHDALYRFDDPLGPGVKLFQSDVAIDWVGAIPNGVLVEHTGAPVAAVDVRTGARRSPPTIGVVPIARAFFQSATHGHAHVPGFGDFETSDGGARWTPASAMNLLAGPRWGILQSDEGGRSWDSRLDDAPLTAKWLAAVGRDPLERAAEHGVSAPRGTAIISGEGSEIARVSLETGAVLAVVPADRATPCRPFPAGPEIHLACEGGVVKGLDTTGLGLLVRWEKKVAEGPFILAPDGGLAFLRACGDDDAKHALCVRQPDGSFRSVPLPAQEIVGRRASQDGSVLVATVVGGSLILTRLRANAPPVEVATWRGCRPTGVQLDEWAPDNVRVVTLDGCDGRGPNQLLTISRGQQEAEVLDRDGCIALGLGRVVNHTGHSIRVRNDAARFEKAASFSGGECHVSAAGLVAGYEVHIGWEGLAIAHEPPKPSTRQEPPPVLRCAMGALAAASSSRADWVGRRPKLRDDAAPIFEPGLFAAIRAEDRQWHVDWWDLTELGPRRRHLAVRAPAPVREPHIVAAAASGENLVVLVEADDAPRAWALRKWGSRITTAPLAASGPSRMALGPDGAAAWVPSEAPGDLRALPMRAPAYAVPIGAKSPLPLAPTEAGVVVFAPEEGLAAQIVADAKVKSPPPLDHYEAVAGGSSSLSDLRACAAGLGGPTVRIFTTMRVDGGSGASYERLVIDVSTRPGEPCIARVTEWTGRFRVDFLAGAAESVADDGVAHALTCAWNATRGP